jgi:predicted nuclease with TOPRIM domain
MFNPTYTFSDQRDVQKRHDELEEERNDFQAQLNEAQHALEQIDDPGLEPGADYDEWKEAWDAVEHAKDELNDFEAEFGDELDELEDALEELPQDAPMIPADDFEDYIKNLVEESTGVDLYDFPFNYIDWEQVAEEAQQDYGEVTIRDITYLYNY